ncbi:sensor histidine kinase [Aestuariibacter salexigens]|uniref:sensor histidine kinase n=1 Tax=Aestuariibacter salexigens TaxID=226010 RepID=UPI0004106255|nr:HAMP domain-containing sensor histidine kinase [Aestuariibacter salexigens]
MQLKSLRQLTLGSFILALVPLATLLWQSQRALDQTSQMAEQETRFAVTTVNKMSAVERQTADLERRMRQFFVLRSDEFSPLLYASMQEISEDVGTLCEFTSAPDLCRPYQNNLDALQDYEHINDDMLLEARLAELRQSMSQLRLSIDAILVDRIAQQQSTLTSMQRQQAWSTAILVSLSLVLLLYGSKLVVRPVNKLKHLIRAIASNQTELPDISKHAPSELMQLEKDLHWLSERLQQLEQLRAVMLRHAAHELKTPLASMLEGCTLLQEQVVGPLTEQQQEVLDLLLSSTRRLTHLMEQLLDYNVLLQQAEPTMETTSLTSLMQECIQENGLLLQQHGAEVKLQLDCETATIDAELYRRILDNLLSNAVAHGAKGKPLAIRIRHNNNLLITEVANSGKPIPAAIRASLFEPFKRGHHKRNDNVVGAGLGLSIVADCARMMHGSVKCVDVDYADVCFRVCIPQHRSEAL